MDWRPTDGHDQTSSKRHCLYRNDVRRQQQLNQQYRTTGSCLVAVQQQHQKALIKLLNLEQQNDD
jgi:hypothetical protein